MTPVTFGGCFGWLHHAAGGRGVVLCGSLGIEEAVTHRAWFWLACRLAEAGLPSLRFDPLGTGDSLGDETEPGRLEAWRDSLRQAVAFLRRHAGVREVALVGLRFGALLAADLAAELAADRLVLLAPPDSGKAYLREMTALSRLAFPTVGAPADPPEWRDDLEVGGFVLTAGTQADLCRLAPAPPPPRCRVLVLPHGGGKAFPGTERVERLPFTGYAELFSTAPHSAEIPEAAFTAVVDWLAADQPVGSRPERRLPAPRLVTAQSEETPFQFGPGLGLFGVYCRPAGPITRPPVLFLNTGANHHIGANRLAVTMARSLAARGVPSFRFDIAGLGDSLGPPLSPPRLLYSLNSCAEVREAIDLMNSLGHRRCLLFGLCSGAYLGFYTAQADPRVCGLVMVNLQTFHWREGDRLDLAYAPGTRSMRFYLAAAAHKESWRRLASGEARLWPLLREMGRRIGGRLPAPAGDALVGFRRLAERGTEVRMVYSLEDNGLSMLESHLGPSARKMRRWPGFRLSLIKGADHTMTRRWARRHLTSLLAEFVLTRIAADEDRGRMPVENASQPHL